MNTVCLLDLLEKEKRLATKIDIINDSLFRLEVDYADGDISEYFYKWETECYNSELHDAEGELKAIRLEMKQYFQRNGFGCQWIG